MRRSVLNIRTQLRKTWLMLFGGFLVLVSSFAIHREFFMDHSHLVPAQGGIFTESTIGVTRNLNPLSSDGSLFDQDLHSLIYEGLQVYNPKSGQIEDGLAERRISEDFKTYFMKLKKNAKFQNGQPVTVDDVLFTFEEVIQNPNFSNQNLRQAFEYISIDVVDKRTLSFSLPEQNMFFLSLLTVPILPAKAFSHALIEEITDPNYPTNKHPIGAGPYRLKNIVPNDDGSFRAFLERNVHYYKETPKIDQIVFHVYPNFEHLNVAHPWSTMFSKIPFVWLEKFQEKIFDQYQLETQYQKREYLLPRFTGLFFNLDRPLPAKPAIRKALLLVFDKEKILGKEKGWEKIDSFFFFDGVESWHVGDTSQANRYLRDGGFPYVKSLESRTIGKGGDILSLKLITSTDPPVYSRFAQNIARTWEKELGVKIELEVLEKNDFQKALKAREYDIVLFGQNFSRNFDTLSTWHSSQTGQFNLSNLTNKDIDFLIGEIRFSGAQRDLFTLNEELDALIPAITLATPKYNLLLSKDLKGFSENFGKVRSHSDRFWGIENWYFYEERDWNLPPGKSKIMAFFGWIFE